MYAEIGEAPTQSNRYPEEEVDEMIEEYKAKFGGAENWRFSGERKFIAVKGAAVEFDRAGKVLYIRWNMNTGVTTMRILQVKKDCKKGKELINQPQVLRKKGVSANVAVTPVIPHN